MRKESLKFLIFGAALLVATGLSAPVNAGVNVNIGIDLPVLAFPAPPPLVVVPGTYVYTVPEAREDIVFYHDYWYRPYGGRWYRARSYNGPWGFVSPNRVPVVIHQLPPNYRNVPPGHERIPYGQLKKNWGRWERDRYWEREERHDHGHGHGNGHKHEDRDDDEGHGHRGRGWRD